MKYKILIFPLFYLSYINGYDLSEYEAKYKFESNEISITGIREFKKNQDGYEIRFNASNLIASLFFSSKFSINNDEVNSKTYDVKIRPKFLKKNQSEFLISKRVLLNQMVILLGDLNLIIQACFWTPLMFKS